MELIMSNEGNVQLFPRSDKYRENIERIKWDDSPRVEGKKKKKFTGASESIFQASEEDIKKLKEEVKKRTGYGERFREHIERQSCNR